MGEDSSRIIEVDVGRRRFLHVVVPIRSLRNHYDPENKIVKMIRRIVRNAYYFLKGLAISGGGISALRLRTE